MGWAFPTCASLVPVHLTLSLGKGPAHVFVSQSLRPGARQAPSASPTRIHGSRFPQPRAGLGGSGPRPLGDGQCGFWIFLSSAEAHAC